MRHCKFSILRFLFLSMILCPLEPLRAQIVSDLSGRASTLGQMEFRGLVTDAMTQLPLDSALVEVKYFIEFRHLVYSAYTDAQGRYSITVPIENKGQRYNIGSSTHDFRSGRCFLTEDSLAIGDSIMVRNFQRCPVERMGTYESGDRIGPVKIGKRLVHEIIQDSLQRLPAFPGGNAKLKSFLKKRLRYTAEMDEFDVNDTVKMGFLVNVDGNISDILIFRDCGVGAGLQVINAVQDFPKWQPYEVDGRKIPCYMYLNVEFNRR